MDANNVIPLNARHVGQAHLLVDLISLNRIDRDSLTVAAVMQRGEEAIAELLGRVGVRVTPADMAHWTDRQWKAAEQWAATAYLWDARWTKPCPPMPDFLLPFSVAGEVTR